MKRATWYKWATEDERNKLAVTEQELADAKYLVRSYSADRRLIVNRCIKRAARAAKGRK